MRRFIVYVCLAVVLAAALAPLSSGLPWAILNPVLLFVAFVIVAALVRELERSSPLIA